ncbi:hypothetical protein chiPu_0015829 [Chiloscyllium punctatum]|uniref:Uncharacterized protein n=1 Tax=Chiloscyllium punctatum TaxID=137246 RepID=A0A401T3V8_CHIPU|nr:hypothetical protein [Chiloscyllium punctatum]
MGIPTRTDEGEVDAAALSQAHLIAVDDPIPRGKNDVRNKVIVELLGIERLSDSQKLLGRTNLQLIDIVQGTVWSSLTERKASVSILQKPADPTGSGGISSEEQVTERPSNELEEQKVQVEQTVSPVAGPLKVQSSPDQMTDRPSTHRGSLFTIRMRKLDVPSSETSEIDNSQIESINTTPRPTRMPSLSQEREQENADLSRYLKSIVSPQTAANL